MIIYKIEFFLFMSRILNYMGKSRSNKKSKKNKKPVNKEPTLKEQVNKDRKHRPGLLKKVETGQISNKEYELKARQARLRKDEEKRKQKELQKKRKQESARKRSPS
jgi:hypothetical protein